MELLRAYNGNNVQAKSAKEDLDIDTILKACSTLEQEIANLSFCARELSISSNELGKEAFSINNSTPYSNTIDDYVNDIQSFQNDVYNVINDIRLKSINKYNQIQYYYNDQALEQDGH